MEDEFNLQMFTFLFNPKKGYLIFGTLLFLIFSLWYFFKFKAEDRLFFEEILEKMPKRLKVELAPLFYKKRSRYFAELQEAFSKEKHLIGLKTFRKHLVNYYRVCLAKWILFFSFILFLAALFFEREFLVSFF